MSLKLRNRWKYTGDRDGDWWDWEVFLDDFGSGELGRVESVEYVLHPTFEDPIREIDKPDGGFALKTGGWGDFKLKAFVHLKNGEKVRLTHDLVLKNQPVQGVSA